jgi:glycosyltransferase involved in cell wall biosynthesis
MTRPIRVVQVVSHPIQYFAPLYRELASRPEIELTVLYERVDSAGEFFDPQFDRVVRWNADLLGGYRWRVAGPRGTATAVARLRADVVWIHGYARRASWAAAAAARTTGAPVLLRDDQTGAVRRRAWRQAAKGLAVRLLLHGGTVLATGQANRRYFEGLGVAADAIRIVPHSVDNRAFRARAEQLQPRRAELRAALGVHDDRAIVLFCGKLIAQKQPAMLLEAYARVRAERPCALVVVGDGPLRAATEAAAERLGVADVRFAGFRDQRGIAEAYAAADLLVLPSASETWGLVVNEAFNFGLPVVASDRVGCVDDLVAHGQTGLVVGHADVEALAGAIAALVDDADLRAKMGTRARRRIEAYGVAECADAVVRACSETGRSHTRDAVVA